MAEDENKNSKPIVKNDNPKPLNEDTRNYSNKIGDLEKADKGYKPIIDVTSPPPIMSSDGVAPPKDKK